ncbi:hypothetical protein LIER_08601 [Lithospermum erythrorhizon]|uniref:CRIB domain-containing protein n=1 Tax=Lithospermum erythrorhizon TaxID=34254 RepID=A0AAV3PEN4_LITER
MVSSRMTLILIFVVDDSMTSNTACVMQKTKSNSVKMGSRVKGLLKGLRCISQIFDEEKEAEMKIGIPTDVKHVAHIGWDGPSADSPSWMKSFESSGEGNQEVQKASNSSGIDQPDVPKSTRRISSKKNSSSPKKGKSRQSRHHLKDSKKVSKNTKLDQDGNVIESDSTAGELPKKSRRKKSKDSSSSRSSKSRGSGSDSDFPDQECSYNHIAPNMTTLKE